MLYFIIDKMVKYFKVVRETLKIKPKDYFKTLMLIRFARFLYLKLFIKKCETVSV